MEDDEDQVGDQTNLAKVQWREGAPAKFVSPFAQEDPRAMLAPRAGQGAEVTERYVSDLESRLESPIAESPIYASTLAHETLNEPQRKKRSLGDRGAALGRTSSSASL